MWVSIITFSTTTACLQHLTQVNVQYFFFFKAGSSKVKTIHLFNCRQDATWWWTQATAAEHQTEDKTQTYKNSNQQWWTKIMKSSLK